MPINIVGTAPDQVPLNQHLGDLAYQSKEAVRVNRLTVSSDPVQTGTTAVGTILIARNESANTSYASIQVNGSPTDVASHALEMRSYAWGTSASDPNTGSYAGAGQILVAHGNPAVKNLFISSQSGSVIFQAGSLSGERMRINSDGNVGIGTTTPSYNLHVPGTSSLEAARYIYIPHTGVSGGYGSTAISNIHIGSYLDLQHFSFTNSPAIFFNGRIKRSDFVGSGSGTASSYNIIEPYFSGGNYALISTVNGGISFNIGSWGGNSEIDLGDISNHSSYKGGHDGNSFVIRSTGANGLNMRPDAGDSNNSARAFFVNSSQTWAIMNNSGNLSFRSGATVGSDSGTQKVYFDTSGNVTISGVLTENSSIALKENVNPISNALDYISQLVGVTYDRKDGSAKNRAGLIKEEVEKVLPNVVNDNGIQYTNIIAYLVESIKDLKKEIDDLKRGK